VYHSCSISADLESNYRVDYLDYILPMTHLTGEEMLVLKRLSSTIILIVEEEAVSTNDARHVCTLTTDSMGTRRYGTDSAKARKHDAYLF